MNKTTLKVEQRKRRQKRVRQRVRGTAERPRLCIFRSMTHIYGQIIDDVSCRTLVCASTVEAAVREGLSQTGNKTAAHHVGKALAQKALAQNIKQVAFDRNGFLYHGRVKAFAEGAREGGLEF